MMHYPLISKRFIIEKKGKFKLFNPYCFKNYLKEVLQVYMNPLTSVTMKKKFCKEKIGNNIFEFGVSVLCLIGNYKEKRILKDPQYLKHCVL